MTVKELREKLNQFDDNMIVMIPNMDWSPFHKTPSVVAATSVTRGCNEADGCVFIDSYMEED